MFGLPAIDVAVIVLYLAVVVAIGGWCSRRIRDQTDYFLAGRGLGKLVQTFAAFGQGTSAENAVVVTMTTFVNGASGIWSSLLYLFATPFYWLVSPWVRRLRVLTMGDFFLERYQSQAMAATYAVIGSIGMMSFIAAGFSAMTKTVLAMTPKPAAEYTAAEKAEYELAAASYGEGGGGDAASRSLLTYEELVEKERLESTPPDGRGEEGAARLAALEGKAPAAMISHLRENVLIWLVCFVVMIYAVAGGLEAAFLTDLLQGVFIIALSVVLIPFAWMKVNAAYGGAGVMGALRTIHRQLPEPFFDIFGSPHSIDFTWYYILALSGMAALTVVIQPNYLVANGSARDEYAARYGFVVGNFMKRFCTVFWGVFALAAIVLYGGKGIHPDLIWGYASRDLLGPLHLGLVGLMIAALMAALMSTADCLMLTCSSLLTHNLYQPIVAGRSSRHYVWAGRIFGALVLIGSVLIATQFDTIFQLMKFIWEFNVMLAPAFWLGMKWRRANRGGAWASILIAGFLFFILPILLPQVAPGLRTSPRLLKTTHPAPLTRHYTAGPVDVERRSREIAVWEDRRARGEAVGRRPERLVAGRRYAQQRRLPRKGVFWTQDVKPDDTGRPAGRGRLNLELLLLDRLGFDLASNPYALNETIRIGIRTIAPFLIMVLFTWAARPDDRSVVERFFAKMRTKVSSDRGEDARRLQRSLEDPQRHKDQLLFPNSQWEFYRWNREDGIGFCLSIVAVAGVLLLMTLLVSMGA